MLPEILGMSNVIEQRGCDQFLVRSWKSCPSDAVDRRRYAVQHAMVAFTVATLNNVKTLNCYKNMYVRIYTVIVSS